MVIWPRVMVTIALLGAAFPMGAGAVAAAEKKPAPAAGNEDAEIVAPPVFGGETQPAPPKPEAKPGDPKPAPAPSTADPNDPAYRSGPSPAAAPDRDKLVESLKQQLAEVKPGKTIKKADNDFFAVSTVELVQHKVTVDYPIYQGEKEAAERLADFLSAPPKDAVRKWWVLGRVKAHKAAENLVTKARAQSIEGKLTAFPMTPRTAKKSADDAFVIGTAEIQGDHADVRFQVLQGTRDAANFIMEFILSAAEGAKRQWHVFSRAKSEDEADKFVQQLRSDYDRLEAQRQAVADAYNVRTTRRC
jgi:hypothetical protein